MKKGVLVTGADGFIGKKLSHMLKSDYEVSTFSIGDGDIANDELKFKDISHVFHLAALTFVPYSWENPKEFYRVNVQGTENVLDFCKNNGASLTFISTYVYGMPKYLPIDENHPIDPNSPYNHSKYLAEQLCNFYSANFGVQTTVLRPFNIYGKGQAQHFLIPEIVGQLLDTTKPEIKLQTLTPKRDYVHINDVISALMLTLNQKKSATYNIASGVSVSVGEIADIVKKVSGINKGVVSANIERKNEVTDICADISFAKANLGWQPGVSFEEGIGELVR